MSAITVGLLMPHNPEVQAIIAATAPETWTLVSSDGAAGSGRFHESAPLFDYLIVYGEKLDKTLFDRAARLRMIQKFGVGSDDIDTAACAERGIALAVCTVGSDSAVSEHAIALIFAALKRITNLDHGVRREREWPRWEFRGRIRQLAGSTVGVIGYGGIGRATAWRLRALGAHVLVHTRREIDLAADAYDGSACEFGSLHYTPHVEGLFDEASIVSIHCPLTPQTRGMVTEDLLNRLGPEGILVNTARGGVVDEDALTRALAEGRLGFAALDVLAAEPPPASLPLLSLPNVIVTPHVGGGGLDVIRAKAAFVMANIEDHRAGRPVRTQIL